MFESGDHYLHTTSSCNFLVVTKMRAWFMDTSSEDQRLLHHLNPPEFVTEDKLAELGVLHWVLSNADEYETNPGFRRIREERGYSYEDSITISPDKLPDYEQKMRIFFEEHIHTDEEIRYCLAAAVGYFDIRNWDDKWIRIHIEKGDMIVLPAGSYHRFSLDENNYIKALRLFVGAPVWTAHNRPQEDHPVR